ncbi:MAG TPA: enoyl-CoA hydratase [Gemmataceae bacterium]|nr:enoyl-CoA hydratase [Gemmataceae bacterium]
MQAAATIAPPLLTELREEVLLLTLNRPEKRNALSRELLLRLHDVLDEIAADVRVRVVVLAAQGSAFCAGHDLGEMVGCSEDAYRELFALCSQVMQQFRALPQPVIARVQGMATAAGCQLVAACDLAVASDNAAFATPGVKIGLFCTTPMVPLVRTIPPRAALEMLLTGKAMSAQQALAWQLVNRVVPAEQLDATVREFTDAIRASSPLTIRIGKQAFYDQLALDEASAYDRATDVMTRNVVCQDAQEGMSAFLHKRPPNWTGQ